MTRNTLNRALVLLTALAGPLGLSRLHAATLDQCFQEALKQSETLAQSAESIYQAREQFRQAIAAVLPSAGLNYLYERQDDHAYAFTPDEADPSQYNTATLTLTQPLFQGFAEYAALRDVKDNLAQSKDAHRWAAMQIYQDVAHAFYSVLALEHSRKLYDEQIKAYDKELKEERNFYAIGRARNSDVETVGADKALLVAAAVQTDEQIAVEREVLAFLTGKDPGEQLDASDLPPAGPGSLAALSARIDQRPDVQAALEQDKIAGELVNISEGSHWPSIDLIGHWYPGIDGGPRYQVQRPGVNSTIDWDAEISATLPLFEGGALLSRDREAESVKRQADLNLALVRRQALSNLRTAWETLNGDLAQIKAYDYAFKRSYKAYQDVQVDYRNGLDTIQDVMIDLTAAWAAKQSLQTARFNARDDYEQLQTLAGDRLYLYPEQAADKD